MKKALVDKATKRLCQVELVNSNPASGGIPFPVSDGFEWLDCSDDVSPQAYDFDGLSFVLKPPPPAGIDLSNVDNLDKVFRALALLLRDYCNELQAGAYVQKTLADLKADFKAKWQALP